MFDEFKQRQAAKRVKPGDGRALEQFRWWQLFTGRRLFYLDVDRTDGSRVAYAVDVRVNGKQAGEDGGRAHVYLDGRHHLQSRMPATIPVEGGTVQVEMSSVGLKRVQYVTDDGRAYALTPDPASAIGRRLRFDRDHPSASRLIGVVSVIALVVGLGLNLLELAEPVLGIPPIVERFGRFESPLDLPIWANVALGVAAGFGAGERAMRLRYRWYLDGLGT